MIAAGTVGSSGYREKIEEMDRELMEVVEDFEANVEALHRTKETGEHSLLQSPDGSFSTL
jgi:hypothetical protein